MTYVVWNLSEALDLDDLILYAGTSESEAIAAACTINYGSGEIQQWVNGEMINKIFVNYHTTLVDMRSGLV